MSPMPADWTPPTPAEVRAAREAAGHTQAQAAALARYGAPVRWTELEAGTRRIDRARWDLYRLRARLVTLRELERE